MSKFQISNFKFENWKSKNSELLKLNIETSRFQESEDTKFELEAADLADLNR